MWNCVCIHTLVELCVCTYPSLFRIIDTKLCISLLMHDKLVQSTVWVWMIVTWGACYCCACSHWLPCTHLSQVTSLELRGPVTDQSLGQLPTQLPCLKRLTVDSSYFARYVHTFVLLV